MKKLVSILTLIVVFISIFHAVSKASEIITTLRINEVMPNPVGDDSKNEWIELVNTSSQILNTSNWTINDKPLPNLDLLPGELLIVARSINAVKPLLANPNTKIIELSFSLGNSGGSITLKNDTITNDTFVYSESQEGISFERLYGNCDHIVLSPSGSTISKPNTTCEDYFKPTPTPIVTLTPTPVFGSSTITVFIESISPAPSTEDEWLSLYNYGAKKSSLAGFAIVDKSGNKFTFTTEYIKAGSSLKIYPSGVSLNNDGDRIQLIDKTGTTIDSFEYPAVKTDELLVISTQDRDHENNEQDYQTDSTDSSKTEASFNLNSITSDNKLHFTLKTPKIYQL